MIWSANNLSDALDIPCPGHLQANQIQFNSKDVKPGDLFIALKGVRDGHEFAIDAFKNDAGALVISRNKIDELKDRARKYLGNENSSEYKAFIDKLIKVDDTEAALHMLAKYKRDRSKAKFIAITGSAGKTSTKEALNIILSRFGKCFASRGNFNNKLGLAINLASMPDDIDYAVLELGMNAAGEISELTKQARPDIAAITSIFGVHIEYFGSVEKIAEAKCEIFEGIDPSKGIAILPRDYEGHETCQASLKQKYIKNIKNFQNDSASDNAAGNSDAKMVSYEILGTNVRLVFDISGVRTEITISYIPKHIAGNFTLCLLIAKELGLDLNEAAGALKAFTLGMGRGKVVNSTYKDKYLTIITDYYNSNPESLKCSLENLNSMASSFKSESDNKSAIRKVAIIGDMGELGDVAIDKHKAILKHARKSGITHLILVGKLASHAVDEYDADSDLFGINAYPNIESLLENIDSLIKNNDLILIKASRFMKFEKIAKYLGIENAL